VLREDVWRAPAAASASAQTDAPKSSGTASMITTSVGRPRPRGGAAVGGGGRTLPCATGGGRYRARIAVRTIQTNTPWNGRRAHRAGAPPGIPT
jgi:hypothetical protein